MRNLIRTSLLGIFVGIFVACQPLPSAVFQNKSCSPPCWNGITPGETTIKEIKSKLESIPEVDKKSIKMIPLSQAYDCVDFYFLPYTREIGGRIYAQDNVVQVVSFFPISTPIQLSEIIQEWGPPDQYIAIYYSKVEKPYLATSIIYIKRGIILNNIRDMRANEVPRFAINYQLQDIWFYNPTSTPFPLEIGPINNLNDQDLLVGLKPWTGLREIQYITR